jgi:predicted Zn-dependent peptidase
MSSLLNQNIREKYGYCYNIYSFANMHADSGEFGVYMGTDPKKVKKSRQLIFRELERMANREVSPRRLNKAVNQVKGSIILGLEGMGSRMMRIARQELYYGRYYTLDEVMDQVNSIEASDLKRVAIDLFDPARFTTIELLPEA